MNSKRFQLNHADAKKIGKGALIAIGGALLAYAAEILPQIEFGDWTPIAVAIGGILINAGWKWIKPNA